MYFNLKKHNTNGISYKDDGQIPKSKIKDGKIINSNITFKKSYKLKIRASKVLNKKRSIKKETLSFSKDITLLDAIKIASKRYDELMEMLSEDIFKNDPANILKPNMLFEDAWEFVRSKEDEIGKDNSIEKQFYKNWLQSLYKKPLNKIAPNDIKDIANMLKKAGRADRTQRRAYQVVNYIYSEINKSTTEFVLVSPASMKGLPPLGNKSNLELSLENSKKTAKALRDYPISPFREVFMWLLRGRRRGEVLNLKWEDIDFKEQTYTIKEISNKAGVNMTYKLSKRLINTLETFSNPEDFKAMKGYVFKSLKKDDEHLNIDSLRNHWKRVRADNDFPFERMHDIRKLLSEYLMNQMLQNDNVVDSVLGHIPSGIASRYATIKNTTVGSIVDKALDGLLGEKTKNEEVDMQKLEQLQKLFPDKPIDDLIIFLKK